MKKLIITLDNPNGSLVDMTAEEISAREIEVENNLAEETARAEAEANAKAEQDALKASAKAKLIAGEALTEEEANTIVL